MRLFRKVKTTDTRPPIEEINELIGKLSGVQLRIRHDHTVTNTEKIPRPTSVVFSVSDANGDGQWWRLPPMNLSYQTSVPVHFPLVWLTGRTEDNGRTVEMRADLQYDPRDMS